MKSIRIRYGDIGFNVLWILLFLAGMNLKAKFFYIILFATIVALFVLKNKKVNVTFWVYVLLSVVIMIYNLPNGVKQMLKSFAYPMAYYIGLSLCSSLSPNRGNSDGIKQIAERRVYKALLAPSLGAFAHYIANYFYNWGQTLGRNTNDIWTGEMLSATGQVTLACLAIGLAVSMVISPIKKRNVFWGSCIIIGVLLYNLTLAGRTCIVLLLFITGIGICYRLTFVTQKEKYKTAKYVLLVSVAILTLWAFNIGGIRDYVQSSNLYLRFFSQEAIRITDSGRMQPKIAFIQNMWRYPLGGSHMHHQYGYAHDLLLDAYDEYGIAAFGVLVVILVDGIKNLYFFCKKTQSSMAIKSAYLCVYSVFLIMFFLEPILAGMEWILVCYCIVNGALYSINNLHRRLQLWGKDQ